MNESFVTFVCFVVTSYSYCRFGNRSMGAQEKLHKRENFRSRPTGIHGQGFCAFSHLP